MWNEIVSQHQIYVKHAQCSDFIDFTLVSHKFLFAFTLYRQFGALGRTRSYFALFFSQHLDDIHFASVGISCQVYSKIDLFIILFIHKNILIGREPMLD